MGVRVRAGWEEIKRITGQDRTMIQQRENGSLSTVRHCWVSAAVHLLHPPTTCSRGVYKQNQFLAQEDPFAGLVIRPPPRLFRRQCRSGITSLPPPRDFVVKFVVPYQVLLPTYNILDGAQSLLEVHKVGRKLVGGFGVKAILPRKSGKKRDSASSSVRWLDPKTLPPTH